MSLFVANSGGAESNWGKLEITLTLVVATPQEIILWVLQSSYFLHFKAHIFDDILNNVAVNA